MSRVENVDDTTNRDGGQWAPVSETGMNDRALKGQTERKNGIRHNRMD